MFRYGHYSPSKYRSAGENPKMINKNYKKSRKFNPGVEQLDMFSLVKNDR